MSKRPQPNTSGFLGWVGLIILAGLFVFKWIPDWTWHADLPEISINNYIFEHRPYWQGDTAIIESEVSPTIHIRISPKKAIEERANLKVTVNGREVSENCISGTETFCYKITGTADKSEYSIVAKNDAGESHATVRVAIREKTPPNKSESSSDVSNTSKNSDQPQSTPANNTPRSTAPTTSPTASSTCLHSVAGTCLDDYEDEAYSAGAYDHEYGYYGTSLDFPDDCNTICQESLEDAYDEGWYDYH